MQANTHNLTSTDSTPDTAALANLTLFNPESESKIHNSLVHQLENKVFPNLGLNDPMELARLIEIVIKMSKSDTILAACEKFLDTKSVILNKFKSAIVSLNDHFLLERIMEHNLRSFGQLITELTDIKNSNTAILDATSKATKAILLMANSAWKVSENFDFRNFKYYDLDTPLGLGDKACDELVESILKAYGHQNNGKYLEDRRNIKLSSWKATFVPDSVKDLVKYRRTASSQNLSGEKVRPILQTVKLDIAEQIAIERSELSKVLKLSTVNIIDPEQIIAASRDYFRNESHKHTDIIKEHAGILKAVSNSLISIDLILGRLASFTEEIQKIFKPQIDKLVEHEKKQQAIINEQKAEASRQQQLIIRVSQAESYAANPDYLIKQFESNNLSNIRQVLTDIINFCTDRSKNNLLDHLFELSSAKAGNNILTHFAETESDLLMKILKKSPHEVELLDHLTAIFPRLTAISLKFPQSETPEYIKKIFSFSGFPAWVIDWYNYEVIKQQERRNYLPSIRELAFEFLGYAWTYVQKFELPKALSLDGGEIKRGLIEIPKKSS